MTVSTDNQARFEALEQTLAQLQQVLAEQQHEISFLRSVAANPLVKPGQNPPVATGRRRFLKSLAGLGGAGLAALAFGSTAPAAEAKFLANAGAGAIVGLSSTTVSGGLPAEAKYGFIATARPTLALDNLLTANVGAYAEGDRYGVYGYCSVGVGERAGVRGVAEGEYARGVYGSVEGSNSYGLVGEAAGANSTGVYGVTLGTNSSALTGITTGANSIAVAGYATGGNSRGILGEGRLGVTGVGTGMSGDGIRIGVVGSAGDFAGYFEGNTIVIGTFAATTKQFRIDHPKDPANFYLQHTSIESDRMLNIYTGTVTLDSAGQGTVRLPDWFEILNKDFTYHLTPFGPSSQPYIAAEIKKGQFQIAGGQAGQRVSWLVSGVRQDEWAKANPLEVEKPKPAKELGTYLHPELYGQTQEKSLSAKIGI
jgi:trimeric autotransporter adhesin